MKILLVVLICISSNLFAANRVQYCNGMFSFVPTKNIDINFIKAQSTAANCKNELKIKLKGNRKIVQLSFPSESNQLSIEPSTSEDFIAKKEKNDIVINQRYLLNTPNGDVKIETFITLKSGNSVDSIEKYFYFSKKDTYSIYATYKINPENKDEATMLNELEIFFLSLRVDWN
ncbi:hypothetical protein [Chitinibacter sp. ZOR0017]|uniref:hypothetical protein n=1 Tax=Chitinibacter sp. ZOR0017 TaxID=1339254 RepID=UPI0006472986|nr:hypothetical protein [Chitinibacter sp. ZOR0017]